MRIDTIHITNFHGIEQAEYNLHPSVTVLIGANATGKSAILDALAVAVGSYFLGIDGLNSVVIKNSDIRQELCILSDESVAVEYYTFCQIRASGIVHGEQIEWSRERMGLEGRTSQAGSRAIQLLAQSGGGSSPTPQIRPLLSYCSVSRMGVQKKETAKQRTALKDHRAGYMNALDKESSQWAAERWFAGLQGRARDNLGEAPAIFEMAKAKLLSLFARLDRPLTDFRIDYENGDLYVRYQDSNGFIPSSVLSSGYQSVLSIGLDVLYRIYVLNPFLGAEAFDQTPGVMLVDELDMHLHPKWQRHIIDDLRNAFPQIQFVFTTHSPFIVQSLRNARIIDLDRGEERDTGDHIKKSIPEVAEDYMGMQDLERSQYFMEQVQAAEAYFTLLKSTPPCDAEKLAEAKARLDSFEIRYDRDPAFIGLLRAERNASGIDKL